MKPNHTSEVKLWFRYNYSQACGDCNCSFAFFLLIVVLIFILVLQIAQEISKKYKNRPVNIMGEINTV